MSANIKTILIIGATSGLGEQFARRFHALGKKVIASGRRAERLESLKAEFSQNFETVQWDITDFKGLTAKAAGVLERYPEIDAVFQMSGVMSTFSYLDAASNTDENIMNEINTNFTAQAILARTFVPHLEAKAKSGTPATYILVSSGLAFIPMGFWPVYNGTKAAMHAMTLSIRQQVNNQEDETAKKNFHVIELVPPYVATDLDIKYRGSLKLARPPMPLKEYIDDAMEKFGQTDGDGKPLKEIATGFADLGVGLWRGGLGKQMNDMGLTC